MKTRLQIRCGNQVETLEVDDDDTAVRLLNQEELKHGTLFTVCVGNQPIELFCQGQSPTRLKISHAGRHYLLGREQQDSGRPPTSGAAGLGDGTIRAPMPGKIVETMVEAGTAVDAGQTLLIMEAMKMENEIKSPTDATVSELLVSVGQSVETDQILMRVKERT